MTKQSGKLFVIVTEITRDVIRARYGIYLARAIAAYFRNVGWDVLLILDDFGTVIRQIQMEQTSTSLFMNLMNEIAGVRELPSQRYGSVTNLFM